MFDVFDFEPVNYDPFNPPVPPVRPNTNALRAAASIPTGGATDTGLLGKALTIPTGDVNSLGRVGPMSVEDYANAVYGRGREEGEWQPRSMNEMRPLKDENNLAKPPSPVMPPPDVDQFLRKLTQGQWNTQKILDRNDEAAARKMLLGVPFRPAKGLGQKVSIEGEEQ